jgi:hydroxymethylbilane synthase
MAQLRRRRPDLEVVDIRGNVDTRLGKVTSGELDAVILAAAGLNRIGRTDVITELLDPDTWPTAPGQGALAVEVRRGEEDLVRALDHPETRAAVEAEREVLALLEAGCSAPVGARAVVDAGLLLLSASVYSLDGSTALTSSHATSWPDDQGDPSREVAASVARELLGAGAADLTGARP